MSSALWLIGGVGRAPGGVRPGLMDGGGVLSWCWGMCGWLGVVPSGGVTRCERDSGPGTGAGFIGDRWWCGCQREGEGGGYAGSG